jgi:hypothetical protein
MTFFSPLDEIPREKEEIMLAHLTTSEGPNRQSLILKAHKEKVEQIFSAQTSNGRRAHRRAVHPLPQRRRRVGELLLLPCRRCRSSGASHQR